MVDMAELWSPIRLTLALAAITTVLLLVVRHADRLVAGALARALEGGGRGGRRAAAGAAADRAGLLSADRLGPERSGRLRSAASSALRTLAFTFDGLVIGSVLYSLPFVVQPIRIAFEAFGERPLEVAATLRRLALGRLLVGRACRSRAPASSPARCSASPTRSASSAWC